MAEKTVVDQKAIVAKAKELADLIARSDEVEFFKKAEEKIKASAKVQELINAIKKKQKEAVHFEHFQRPDMVKKVEQEIDALQDELDEIPVVTGFKQSQLDINDLLQMVTSIISNTVSEKIIISTGGNPLSGETGYPKAKPGGSDDSCGTGCC
jgi:cell fate (sporulation/competence/biofilm development) regulator YmcA (YheA/YmcA/DUF963 family)